MNRARSPIPAQKPETTVRSPNRSSSRVRNKEARRCCSRRDQARGGHARSSSFARLHVSRPPRDRVNALLSFGYSLLIRDATAAAARVGLDPMLGFLHVVHPGRPALALDLVEPFRAAWVDTAVLRLIATRGIDRDDFVFSSAGVALTDRGRRALIGAYERRADELTTHPRFGYRMSYRRLLELEARVLGKWLVGEIDQFTPIWTR
nr:MULTISPECIES: CRISPR-associated endonuclease Cas1 [unclassified Nannocystis]